LDSFVNQGLLHRADLMYTLGQVPKWAAARPNDPTMYGPTTSGSEPRSLRVWQQHLLTMATRYKGKIKYYEVWNEPNYYPFYTGNIGTMFQMTKTAWETIKGIDPTAKIVSPAATTADEGEAWLDEFLRLGGGQYVDVVAFHFYVSKPEDLPTEIGRIKTILRKYGLENKPIWNTEAGWCIENEGEFNDEDLGGLCPTREEVLSSSEAASYIARSYILAAGGGLSRYYWYAWDDEIMGFTEYGGTTVKTETANAFATVQKWITNKRVYPCTVDTAGVWQCKITTATSVSYVVWNPDKTVAFLPPANWYVRYATTLSGKVTVLGGKAATVGSSPILLTR
jgi:hypothetical protein